MRDELSLSRFAKFEEQFASLEQYMRDSLSSIEMELACIRYMTSAAAGTNTVPSVVLEERSRRSGQITTLVSSLFNNRHVTSRFVAFRTVAELTKTSVDPSLFRNLNARSDETAQVKSCTTLLLAALSFSQTSTSNAEVRQSKKSLIGTAVGKRHIFLKRSIVGTAFISMANDRIVRWKDSATRNAGILDPGEEEDLNSNTISRDYALRNATIVPIDKPSWLHISQRALLHAMDISMPTEAERNIEQTTSLQVGSSKRRRLSGSKGEARRASTSSSSSSAMPNLSPSDIQSIPIITSALRQLTQFFNSSRKQMKMELVKQAFFLIHRDMKATIAVPLDSDVSTSDMCPPDSIPTTSKAYGTGEDALKVYSKNDSIFSNFILSRPELHVQVTYKVQVSGGIGNGNITTAQNPVEKLAVCSFSFLTLAMILLCSFCQCTQLEMLCHEPHAIQACYQIAICLQGLFNAALSKIPTPQFGKDGFPLRVAWGHLELRDYLMGGDCLFGIIRKKRNLTAEEYESVRFDSSIVQTEPSFENSADRRVSNPDCVPLQEDDELGISLIDV